MDNLFLFILLALLTEILGTVGGFGSSLFFVPMASYFFDFHTVLGITALFHVSSNITKITFFRKGFDKKLILSIGIPAVVFVIVGGLLSKFIRTEILQALLAVFLIATSLVLLIFKNVKLKATVRHAIAGGTLSGLIAGLLGTGGAIRAVTLAAFELNMAVFIATSAIIDLAIDASRSVIYFFNGYITKDILFLIPILLLVSVAGTFIGKRILMHVSETQFKSIVLIAVLITGILMLYKVFINVADI